MDILQRPKTQSFPVRKRKRHSAVSLNLFRLFLSLGNVFICIINDTKWKWIWQVALCKCNTRADKVYLNVCTCLKCLEGNSVTLWRYVIVMHCLFLTYTFHIASFWHRNIIDSTLCRDKWHGGCWTQNECVLIHCFDLTFIFRKRPWRNMGTHNTSLNWNGHMLRLSWWSAVQMHPKLEDGVNEGKTLHTHTPSTFLATWQSS